MLERNVMAYRHQWIVLLTGFVEPVLYLLGIGFGIGSLVRNVPIGHGHVITYAMFVAPALMASSAMNGAIYESTFNLFYKLRYVRSFDAIIATPVGIEDATLGEIIWAVGRGSLYSVGFLVLMLALGLVASPWAILAIPAAVLVGFAFAALGAVITTFMRSWQDFDGVQLGLQPMFLFSATFFPISIYPHAIQWVVRFSPLYHAISLLRTLNVGDLGWMQLVNAGYLAVLGLIGLAIAQRRVGKLLLK